MRLGAPSAFPHYPGANILFGLRPDSTAIPQPIDQTTVLGAQDPHSVCGEARFGHQVFKFGKEFLAHGKHITRYSVRVNARYNVRAKPAVAC